LCAFIQSVLGEFLCYRRELQYIPVKMKKPKETKLEDVTEPKEETIEDV
jgi:hypothetical protein